MTPLQLELTRLIGKKELTFGCLIEGSGDSSVNKRYLQAIDSQHMMGYGDSKNDMYQEAFGMAELFLRDCEIIGHPATLSDFHRLMNEKGSLFRQSPREIECVMWIKGSFQRDGTHIPYDSSKDLLDQEEETLKQIVEFIKFYS